MSNPTETYEGYDDHAAYLGANTCPACGAEESLREIATMTTMQPITLAFDDDGELAVTDYEAWDWDGDSSTPTGYDCRACLAEWSDLAALADAMKAAGAPE